MQRQELKLETHEDGVRFVKDIFRSMGGTVLPPKAEEAEDDDSEAADELEYYNKLRQQDEAQFLAGYYEAQTRQRTAYLCKDMVRPLLTPLDDRITGLALTINEQR